MTSKRPTVGQWMEVHGERCKIVKVLPAGTVDVESPSGASYRVTGLGFPDRKVRKARAARSEGGYCNCACPDCFEIAISGHGEPAMCNECEEAGCDGESECQAPGAYGGDGE